MLALVVNHAQACYCGSSMKVLRSERNSALSTPPPCGVRVYASLMVVCFVLAKARGQGTIHVTFDGPPPRPRGTAQVVQEYYESGMRFDSLNAIGFVRSGGGLSIYPENGTAYVQADLGS